MKDIIERLRERHTAQYPMPGGPTLFTEAADALAEARVKIAVNLKEAGKHFAETCRLEHDLAEARAQIVNLKAMSRAKSDEIEHRDAQIAAKDAELAELKGQWERLLGNYASADARAEQAGAQIAAKDAEIAHLDNVLRQVGSTGMDPTKADELEHAHRWVSELVNDLSGARAQNAAKDAALRELAAILKGMTITTP